MVECPNCKEEFLLVKEPKDKVFFDISMKISSWDKAKDLGDYYEEIESVIKESFYPLKTRIEDFNIKRAI